MFKRTLALVISAPSYRDTMYVGYITHHQSGWLMVERAVNILTYEGGIEAISAGPQSCKTSPTSAGHRAYVPVGSVVAVIEVSEGWLAVMPGGEE